jgi:hypothetical protein
VGSRKPFLGIMGVDELVALFEGAAEEQSEKAGLPR